jgi:hypothetical protein
VFYGSAILTIPVVAQKDSIVGNFVFFARHLVAFAMLDDPLFRYFQPFLQLLIRKFAIGIQFLQDFHFTVWYLNPNRDGTHHGKDVHVHFLFL